MNIEDFRTYYLSFKGAYAKTKFEKVALQTPSSASGNGIREIYGNGGFFLRLFYAPARAGRSLRHR